MHNNTRVYCKNMELTGQCKFGNRCKYFHRTIDKEKILPQYIFSNINILNGLIDIHPDELRLFYCNSKNKEVFKQEWNKIFMNNYKILENFFTEKELAHFKTSYFYFNRIFKADYLNGNGVEGEKRGKEDYSKNNLPYDK